MVTTDSKPVDMTGIEKRVSPDGRNLRCACGRWVDMLFTTEANPTPRCSNCIGEERRQRKANR